MAPKSLECQLKVKGFKMNERIRELAEQAGMTDDKFGMFFAKDKHDEDGVDLEKFAELIVKECIDNLAWHGHDEAVRQLEWFLSNKIGG
jgi:hypothetical protein